MQDALGGILGPLLAGVRDRTATVSGRLSGMRDSCRLQRMSRVRA